MILYKFNGKVYLFVNNGNWTFSASQTLSIQLENGWSAPAVADLDGDGDLDIVSGDAKGNLYRFLNNGDDTFAVVDIAAGESDRSRPFICDVNSDGILDITVGYKSGKVSVLYGEKGSVVVQDFHINSSPVFSGTPSAKVEDYQVTLSWKPASDDFGVAGYKVRIGETEYQTTSTTLTLTDIDVGTYSYQVGAVDEAGLESWSSMSTFEVKDVTLPVLNGLPFAKVWKNSVRFSWESASDNVAVAGYRIELNGQTYDTSLTVQFVSGLEVGDYEYRVGGIDTSGLITWSEKQSFTVTELADTLDHVLTETVPTANYGPGCVASSIGMLLGYYDKYGYCGFDVSDLIQGEIELESRNKADALLNTFIATPGYTTRFIGQSESAERPYTLTEQNELNTAAWDSLADWLGTGQKWRGNEDCATAYYYGSLDDVMESQDTYSVSGTALPVKFADFKYGLNLFVESVNYKLDGELTRTVKADTAANGTFSFADYTAEIDAGRGVLISLAAPGNLGHMVLGYGYNEATGEIIFDDTTESGRRMVWNGTYQYAGHEYRIQSITTIVLDTDGLKVLPPVSDVAPQTQTWEKTEDAAQYIMEYSTDNFEHVIQLVVESNSIDSFQMPAGNYQMRVKADGGEWTVIDPVVAEEATDEPKLIRSNADGNADVFFVNTVGTWESGYVAQHVGSTNDDSWGGTEEYASLFGKNKLMDIIEGSNDANVLLMTDDAIGDALFVDDIYSESPDELGLSQSRIAQIDEIRAGAGNDVVDMTSQRFEYIGEGLTIRGGDGNDTIWANKGNNFLFGDAGNDRIVGASGNDVIAGGIGNDRMHGGGGKDMFTFCENWGVDTVEQLAGSSVTLWFASGDESKWNAETLTYMDGDNSVTVKGVASVTLKFGNDGSEQYAALASAGAFAEFTSQKIFEESGKGILA